MDDIFNQAQIQQTTPIESVLKQRPCSSFGCLHFCQALGFFTVFSTWSKGHPTTPQESLSVSLLKCNLLREDFSPKCFYIKSGQSLLNGLRNHLTRSNTRALLSLEKQEIPPTLYLGPSPQHMHSHSFSLTQTHPQNCFL